MPDIDRWVREGFLHWFEVLLGFFTWGRLRRLDSGPLLLDAIAGQLVECNEPSGEIRIGRDLQSSGVVTWRGDGQVNRGACVVLH